MDSTATSTLMIGLLSHSSVLHITKQQLQRPIFNPYTRVELLATADPDEKSSCDSEDTELNFVCYHC